jgi:hypothetical protein
VISELSKTKPETGERIAQQWANLKDMQVRFLAFDSSRLEDHSGGAATLNVVQERLATPLTLDNYGKIAIPQLRRSLRDVLVGTITAQTLSTSYGDALLLNYTVRRSDPDDPPVDLAVTQGILIDKKRVYIITMMVPDSLAEEYGDVFLSVAESFRLLK